MKRLFFFIALTFLTCSLLNGQSARVIDKQEVENKIVEQVLLFPQEKIYLQTDKPVYLSGEKIWFRAYPVDAVLHKPDASQHVYVELKNPADSLVSRIMIKCRNGACCGYIQLKQDIPEGNYTLIAYTQKMLNAGSSYFFRKSIRVATPVSASVYADADFSFEKNDLISVNIGFREIATNRHTIADGLKIMANGEPVRFIRMRNDSVYNFSFRLPSDNSKCILYIENKGYGQYITVPNPPDDYDVTFYPEGGYLPEGTGCRVAFKALTSGGVPETISGRIIDSLGNVYSQFKTLHDGMGLFPLLAEKSKTFIAECKNEKGVVKRFPLPVAQKQVCSLKAEVSRNGVYISVTHSPEMKVRKPLFLIIHTRGMVHFASEWSFGDSSVFFNTTRFPSGIMQVLLLDSLMNPLSERLVFCQNDDQAQTYLETDKNRYAARQEVISEVSVKDKNGKPLEGSFSISVTDDNDIKPDTAINIFSSLLLTSDLKGTINNPAWYFEKSDEKRFEALDLLMMTNGWRRYEIPEVIKGNYTTIQGYQREPMEISGTVRTLILGRPVHAGFVSVMSWKAGFYFDVKTDENGHFVFKGFEYPDSSNFIVQALDKNGKIDGVELFLDPAVFPYNDILPSGSRITGTLDGEEKSELSQYIVKAEKKYTIENGIRTVYLDEVVVKDKAPVKKDYGDSFYLSYANINPSDIITNKKVDISQYQNVADLIKYYLPSVTVQEETSEEGFTRPVVYIDRMRYSLTGAVNGKGYQAAIIIDDMILPDFDLSMLNSSNIESIAVLKGTKAAILGSDAMGGAIIITTKKGFVAEKKTIRYNIKTVMPLGYQTPVEFYSPRYDNPDAKNNSQPDLRTTIYWNPNVILSESGEASLDFYTADASSTYTIKIEGITSGGEIIQKTARVIRK
jgi:hypothetical protein